MFMLHWVRRFLSLSKMRRRDVNVWAVCGVSAWLLISTWLVTSKQNLSAPLASWDPRKSWSASWGANSSTASEKVDLVEEYRDFYYSAKFEYPDPYTLGKDLLVVQVGPEKGRQLASVDELEFYDSDPRLIWSVVLEHLLQDHNGSESLPFSWYDWADFRDYNKLLSLKKTEISCKFFFQRHFDPSKLAEIEIETGEFLFELDRDYYFDVLSEDSSADVEDRMQDACVSSLDAGAGARSTVVTGLKDKVRPEVYRFQARNFLLNTVENPISITLLDKDSGSWQFNVDRMSRKNIRESGLLDSYLQRNKVENRDHVFELSEQFVRFENSGSARTHRVNISEISEEERNAFHEPATHIRKSDFEFDALTRIQELESKVDELTAHEKAYLKSLRVSTQTHYAFAPKYFREPSDLSDFGSLGWHHDARFFNGAIFQDFLDARTRLDSMIRTFQKFLKAHSLISWLAHGTLYGYIYNGLEFPWDNDFDVQMPIRHLHIMAQHFNQTLVLEDPREGNGRFIIDVGSSITTRIKGNGMNNIDARFIDVDSGLYIDITGISVSSAMLTDRYAAEFYEFRDSIGTEIKHSDPNLIANETDLPLQVLRSRADSDPNYTDKDKKALEKLVAEANKEMSTSKSPSKYYSAEQRYNLNYELDLYNCRNHHFLHFDMISPLILTRFHGVPALVPNKYVTTLRKEYSVSPMHGFQTHKGNVFVTEFGYWCTSTVLKQAMNKKGNQEGIEVINSPLNNLNINDVGLLYNNIAQLREIELLSLLYSSREHSTYRLTELKLQYANGTVHQKIESLRNLEEQLGSSLTPLTKDPYIQHLQREKWRALATPDNPSSKALSEVDTGIANDLQNWAELANSKQLPFLKKAASDEHSESIDYNQVDDIDRSLIFRVDPDLRTKEDD
ncbi:LAQU0S03e01024g1_1 [Lachancea quebecensis]|uniref:LAQU0S03e01024g1_1 n=1 Tax=Lachancea quebecensis TaxID=1654605 RepID=A0A0N7ML59_9SACH|nr:LAQU0S03e01024g1_1 [Lachancea quebecensis]